MIIKKICLFGLQILVCSVFSFGQNSPKINSSEERFNNFSSSNKMMSKMDTTIYLKNLSAYNSESLFTGDIPKKAPAEFQFFAFYINQNVVSNMFPQSSLFNGQLVGRLFGQNSSTTSDSVRSMYVEQRLIPFFIYQPSLFNGKAILRASFEIDWTWGDQAYGLSGNKGSAIAADQVNIQTQNIELELIPWKHWAVNIGLQRLFDTPYNPYRTLSDKLMTTGYRLAFWGTDGVGVSVRYDNDFYRLKTGFYKLYENDTQAKDDVNLFELMGEKSVGKTWNVGASVNYVMDRARSQGGVSIYKQGLSSLLAAANGAYVFKIGNEYTADIAWIGTFFSHNPDYFLDRYSLTGFFNYNLGIVDKSDGVGGWTRAANIGGFAANLRAGYRFGQTADDIITADFTYTSGDKDTLADKKYSGVITGNSWGMPGSIFVSSGSYLLFPHSNVVNRFTPIISDISNQGYGVSACVINASKGLIPNKLIAKVGTAFAAANVAPLGGSKYMGTEFNASLKYNFGPYFSLETHAAYCVLGNFFNSNDASHGWDVNGDDLNGFYHRSKPVNPWTAFIVLKWLMF